MIVSVSRRTDIPAFYSEWFFNRLNAGCLLVRNPMNFNQVSRIPLNKKDVECFVFWTKNPQKMLERIEELDGYNYYFQVTITSYGKDIEVGVPSKKNIIESFKQLSLKIGKEKVIWRYDPIILTDVIDEEYHVKYFEYIASHLSSYTDRCVISFVDSYKKIEKNIKELKFKELTTDKMERIAEKLSIIAAKYNIVLETCSEKVDLEKCGVRHGKCIDDRLISKIIGIDAEIAKDPNQREECGCVSSVDVGIYNTCPHRCKYCYANASTSSAMKNYKEHNPCSELLFGELRGDEKVYDRKVQMHFSGIQLRLM